MEFKGAIFDFDGVVVDTTPLHYSSWKKLFVDHHNIEFNRSIYREMVNGRRSAEAIMEMLPHLSEPELVDALNLKQDYYRELIQDKEIPIFKSTIKLIKELRDNNIRTAVASSSRSVDYILKAAKIGDLFDVVISGNDTKFGKPHPESFLKAATQLQLPVANCVVFEDAKVGVQAAKAGGFLCVAVDRNDQPAHYTAADLCVHDLCEICYKTLVSLFNTATK